MAHLVVRGLTSFIHCWLIRYQRRRGCCVVHEKRRRIVSSGCTLSNVDSDHHRRLDDMAHPLMRQVIVIVFGVQRWLGAVEPVMVVVRGGDTVEGDGENLVIR